MASCSGATDAYGSFKKSLTKRVIFYIILFSKKFLFLPPTFTHKKPAFRRGINFLSLLHALRRGGQQIKHQPH